MVGTSPFSRFIRWFESDSPEIELQKFQLNMFKECDDLEQVVVNMSTDKPKEEDDEGDPHKEK